MHLTRLSALHCLRSAGSGAGWDPSQFRGRAIDICCRRVGGSHALFSKIIKQLFLSSNFIQIGRGGAAGSRPGLSEVPANTIESNSREK